jgi:hypothetical protein
MLARVREEDKEGEARWTGPTIKTSVSMIAMLVSAFNSALGIMKAWPKAGETTMSIHRQIADLRCPNLCDCVFCSIPTISDQPSIFTGA